MGKSLQLCSTFYQCSVNEFFFSGTKCNSGGSQIFCDTLEIGPGIFVVLEQINCSLLFKEHLNVNSCISKALCFRAVLAQMGFTGLQKCDYRRVQPEQVTAHYWENNLVISITTLTICHQITYTGLLAHHTQILYPHQICDPESSKQYG